MTSCKVGDRVGAIREQDKKTVYLYGFGVFSGEAVPPADPKAERGMISLVHQANRANPKLTLDDGTVVWGCECWWGPENTIKDHIKGLKVVPVKPPYPL